MTLPTGVSAAFAVQSSPDNATWTTFGAAADLGTILRTRRFALGPRQSVTARYWRVVRLGDDDLTGAVASLDGVAFWAEDDDTLSPVKLYNFDFDVDTQRYVLVATAGNIEVYQADARLASIGTPFTADQLSRVTKVQELDTFLAFHVDVPPRQITRQGANDEWDSRPATFTNVPLFDYTGLKAGGVDEVQQIQFDSYVTGETFNITLEDFTTDPIVYDSTAGTMEANLTAALEALDNVGAGGVTVTNTATDVYSVEFVGDNAAEDFGQMAPVTIHSAAGGVFAATLTQGVGGGEAIFSDARGYPGCGAFYQQRLWMGGLKSRPQTVLGSVIGDYFNFDSKGRPTGAAIDEDLDTDEAVFIFALYPGRHLQVFTSSAEFYFPIEPIVSPAAVKQTTRRGLQRGTPQGFMDGATVFVSRGGDGLCQFQFDQVQESYAATWLNTLAPHLVMGVVDMAFRRALSPKETDQALLVRSDGDIAAMMALLDQNVVGFSRWTTTGTYLAACADTAGDLHVAVQRAVGDGFENFLEAVDPTAWLDHQVTLNVDGDPVTTMALPPHMNGWTVAVMIDGVDAGDRLVVDASIPLGPTGPALRQVVAGCLFVPTMTTLPLVTSQDPRTAVERQMRTGRIALQLGPTSNVSVGIAGGTQWPVPLKRRPAVLTDGADAGSPFTGWAGVGDIPGFADDEAVTVSRPRPGPFVLRTLAVTVDT